MEAHTPDSRFNIAKDRITIKLSEHTKLRQLTAEELVLYKGCIEGWELPDLSLPSGLAFRLLVKNTLPFSPPAFAVYPPELARSWPHVDETTGIMCILPEVATHSIDRPEDVAIDLLIEARIGAEKFAAGDNHSDFEDGFRTYWGKGVESSLVIRSLCNPEGPSRNIVAVELPMFLLLADNKEDALRWIENMYDRKMCDKYRDQITLYPLLWLSRPLRPTEYPSTVQDIRILLSRMGHSSDLLASHISDTSTVQKRVIFGFHGKTGISFCSISLCRKNKKELSSGFRGVHSKIALMRCSTQPIEREVVSRIDHGWIHGRDHDSAAAGLRNKTVVIVGAGSIGSQVAIILAQAGVGQMHIVDMDMMTPENVSRHGLGMVAVGMFKADALEVKLRCDFPHLCVTGYRLLISDMIRDKPNILEEADLIMDTTGSWEAGMQLNAFWLKLNNYKPLLVGRSEANAAAGHAMSLFRCEACMRCLFNDCGHLITPVIEWVGGTQLKPVPTCGGAFQPYGAADLGHIISLIAQQALGVLTGDISSTSYNAWIARKSLLEKNSGRWSQAWCRKYGNPGNGGLIVNIPVDRGGQCPECGKLR